MQSSEQPTMGGPPASGLVEELMTSHQKNNVRSALQALDLREVF